MDPRPRWKKPPTSTSCFSQQGRINATISIMLLLGAAQDTNDSLPFFFFFLILRAVRTRSRDALLEKRYFEFTKASVRLKGDKSLYKTATSTCKIGLFGWIWIEPLLLMVASQFWGRFWCTVQKARHACRGPKKEEKRKPKTYLCATPLFRSGQWKGEQRKVQMLGNVYSNV